MAKKSTKKFCDVTRRRVAVLLPSASGRSARTTRLERSAWRYLQRHMDRAEAEKLLDRKLAGRTK